ncbi:class I SAM-dependent methyltransferase [Aurantimonas sp. MSK8Z-1]|uniref:class I SAM-dependent methyltransferase n=1 Tax=Mangrovibrevibacter kandeliae TaxID=2968473 RepID=UPI002117442B|nr:methyltransferase domain-containing protein [Aurantimonas sp. MSK8Z-1]MCW4115039.1 class I SAM-dependent methyltransferase [Aurantimonas sp. MSK8Z-1]
MLSPQQSHVADHYGARAKDYVTSAVHASGADLDRIEDELRRRRVSRVLDLGCGGGHVSYRAAAHVDEVVACDVTPAMLDVVMATAAERDLTNIRTERAAAEALPFAEASFDAVLCRFTAHHWQDLHAGLREARRVLKPGGWAIVIDSIAPADAAADTHLQTVELLRDPSHVRNYTLAEWATALAQAGFQLEELSLRRMRMVFDDWTTRTRTSAVHREAIRSIQSGAPLPVREHFAIDADGSFDLTASTCLLGIA